MGQTIRGRLVGAWVHEAGALLICFMPGSRSGVSAGATGRLLRDDGSPVPGSDFKVFKAGTRAGFAKVRLGLDQLPGRELELTLDPED